MNDQYSIEESSEKFLESVFEQMILSSKQSNEAIEKGELDGWFRTDTDKYIKARDTLAIPKELTLNEVNMIVAVTTIMSRALDQDLIQYAAVMIEKRGTDDPVPPEIIELSIVALEAMHDILAEIRMHVLQDAAGIIEKTNKSTNQFH